MQPIRSGTTAGEILLLKHLTSYEKWPNLISFDWRVMKVNTVVAGRSKIGLTKTWTRAPKRLHLALYERPGYLLTTKFLAL